MAQSTYQGLNANASAPYDAATTKWVKRLVGETAQQAADRVTAAVAAGTAPALYAYADVISGNLGAVITNPNVTNQPASGYIQAVYVKRNYGTTSGGQTYDNLSVYANGDAPPAGAGLKMTLQGINGTIIKSTVFSKLMDAPAGGVPAVNGLFSSPVRYQGLFASDGAGQFRLVVETVGITPASTKVYDFTVPVPQNNFQAQLMEGANPANLLTGVGSAKLTGCYINRNAGNTISTYAAGSGVLRAILSALGATPAYPNGNKVMTTNPNENVCPALFTGSMGYGCLHTGVPNGTYSITFQDEDGAFLSFPITVTDNGPSLVLLAASASPGTNPPVPNPPGNGPGYYTGVVTGSWDSDPDNGINLQVSIDLANNRFALWSNRPHQANYRYIVNNGGPLETDGYYTILDYDHRLYFPLGTTVHVQRFTVNLSLPSYQWRNQENLPDPKDSSITVN